MTEKHARVAETLLEDEDAVFALAAPELEKFEGLSRCALDWNYHEWIETDPSTGAELERGSYERGIL
ncbi:hypothetical protein [Hyphomicrobium sp. ghe19]|uniref:hypothetical protein n=1 Tax=Hyphomicrobium sp. ghe19 TaxID=2682968 RepID=UPI001366AE6E|nr:hypothetical protein HYPP_03818 [Hyphomicrobium sp. ghe19]